MPTGYKITVGGTTYDLEEIYDSGTTVIVGNPNFKTDGTSGILGAASPNRTINSITYTNFKSDQNPLTNLYTSPTGGIGSGAAAETTYAAFSRSGTGQTSVSVPGWAQGFSCYVVSARGAQGSQGPQNSAKGCPNQSHRSKPGGPGGPGGYPALAYTTNALELQSSYPNVVVDSAVNGIKITHGTISIQANNGETGGQGNAGSNNCRGSGGNTGADGPKGNVDVSGFPTEFPTDTVVATGNQDSRSNINKLYKIHFLI